MKTLLFYLCVFTFIPLSSHADLPWKKSYEKQIKQHKLTLYSQEDPKRYLKTVAMRAELISPDGKKETIVANYIDVDLKELVQDYAGEKFDFDGDGQEDLIVKSNSGGVHCCNTYHVFSLGTSLKKIAYLPMKDCGKKIVVQDLNQDGKAEILTCNADFTYLGERTYSDSPFPPMIYEFDRGQFIRNDKKFAALIKEDIDMQKSVLQSTYSHRAALQIVVDWLLLGEKKNAWKELKEIYQGEDRDQIKKQLLKRLES